MGPSRKQTPNPIDKAVGARVRMRRNFRGMTQTALADALGITFQQVQKYETGTNRISASRLEAIARTLEVPVSFFFEREGKAEFPVDDAAMRAALDFITTREGISLVKTFLAIKDGKLRHAFLSLLEKAGAGGRT